MKPAPAIAVARLARFDASGLAAFDATPTGLLNALAPWLAFALVFFALALLSGEADGALGGLLGTVVALLAPPVLSEALARLWGREAAWLRYAVALVWCLWIMPAALLATVIATGLLVAAGLSNDLAERIGGLALLAYALALHGFLARRALDLSRWRTVLYVAIVNIGTGVLVYGPVLLRLALDQPA